MPRCSRFTDRRTLCDDIFLEGGRESWKCPQNLSENLKNPFTFRKLIRIQPWQTVTIIIFCLSFSSIYYASTSLASAKLKLEFVFYHTLPSTIIKVGPTYVKKQNTIYSRIIAHVLRSLRNYILGCNHLLSHTDTWNMHATLGPTLEMKWRYVQIWQMT